MTRKNPRRMTPRSSSSRDTWRSLRAPRSRRCAGREGFSSPLLKRGFRIDGVDDSASMLRNLKARCLRSGLAVPEVYFQDVSELSISRRYSLIFIALGSLQLLSEDRAINSIERLSAHLAESGRLIIDTFIPWELIESPHSKQVSTRKVRGNRGLYFTPE